MIKYDPICGSYILNVCKKAVNLANEKNEVVSFEFNGITVLLSPNDDPEELAEEWFARDNQRKIEYWTPQRLQEKANKESQDFLNIQNHFETLKNVDSRESLIRWFCELEKMSFIHASLNHAQKVLLTEKCMREFGIYSGMNCPDTTVPKGGWDDQSREYKLNWLAGQALEGTLSIGCPHGIIHKFAEDFGL